MCSNRQDGHHRVRGDEELRGLAVRERLTTWRQIRLCWLLFCLTHVPVWLETSTKFTLWASPLRGSIPAQLAKNTVLCSAQNAKPIRARGRRIWKWVGGAWRHRSVIRVQLRAGRFCFTALAEALLVSGAVWIQFRGQRRVTDHGIATVQSLSE